MQETPDTNAKRGMSTGAKWGLGIGLGCLGLILLLGIGGFVVFKVFKSKLQDMTVDLKSHGFEKTVTGQLLEVREPIKEPVIYIGQVVKIYADCQTNLAIVAQMAEVFGRVEGKLYFRGQMLTIQPKAEVVGGLDATAQVVKNLGKVNGEITGQHPPLDSPPAQKERQ